MYVAAIRSIGYGEATDEITFFFLNHDRGEKLIRDYRLKDTTTLTAGGCAFITQLLILQHVHCHFVGLAVGSHDQALAILLEIGHIRRTTITVQ